MLLSLQLLPLLISSALVLSGFFTQFGRVTKVRLSRNKKTGKAKHYAFLEFQYPEVAAVAAEAMDGYMMFKQKLSVHVMPAKVCLMTANVLKHSRVISY